MSGKTKGRGRKAATQTQENVIDSTSEVLNGENGDSEKPENVAASSKGKNKAVKRKPTAASTKKAVVDTEKTEEMVAKRSRQKPPKELVSVEVPQTTTKTKRGAPKQTVKKLEVVEKAVESIEAKPAEDETKQNKKGRGKTATVEAVVAKIEEEPAEDETKQNKKGRGKTATVEAVVAKIEEEPAESPKGKGRKGAKRGAAGKATRVAAKEPETNGTNSKANDSEDAPPPSKKARGRKPADAPPSAASNAEETAKGTRGRGVKGKISEEVPPPAEPVEEQNAKIGKTAKKGAAAGKKPTPAKSGKKQGAAKKSERILEEIEENGEGEGDHEEIITAGKKSKPADKKKGGEKLLNATDTNYDQLDFSTDKEFNLKISSWNIAGMRAWIKKGGLEYIKYEKPDIICLQEIKCVPDQIPDEARLSGYHPYWLCKPGGHAGVAIYSKIMPINVEYGLGDGEQDEEGRLLTAEYEKFFLICVYVPNAGRKLVTLPKRLRWNKLFEAYVSKLNAKKPVIICGDMNVAHNEIDLANPKTNKKNAGFTQEERDGMTDLLNLGYVDTYRHFYPNQERAFTFWAYFMNSRAKDVGWRLDYFLVAERILSKCVDNIIRSKVLGSDHCPLTLLLNI